ncbi:hypothetical protein FNV43_RR05825 [Rhamnella rubrinervis]|uniref:Uncharacterized protein n=1 Tax=Rhamnella rubrinervis TaxID=2594499 RepID=A0A8K0MRH3_9ROSA|nr:hypothetical protein FNV43_RR05825 [Rhamnella rubrinervis]
MVVVNFSTSSASTTFLSQSTSARLSSRPLVQIPTIIWYGTLNFFKQFVEIVCLYRILLRHKPVAVTADLAKQDEREGSGHRVVPPKTPRQVKYVFEFAFDFECDALVCIPLL